MTGASAAVDELRIGLQRVVGAELLHDRRLGADVAGDQIGGVAARPVPGSRPGRCRCGSRALADGTPGRR